MRIFIGHFSSPQCERSLGISPAASNFCNNLVGGGIFDRAYSILPPFVRGKRDCKALQPKAVKGTATEVLYSPFRRLPRLLAPLAPLWEQLSLLRRIPRGSSVWVYNVTPINYYLIRALRRLKPSVKVYPIVLDFTPGEKGNDKFLREINRAAGRITLSHYNGISQLNSACLPGVTPQGESLPKADTSRRDFLLSGVVSENIASISNVIKAFAQVPEATLHITSTLSDRPDLLAIVEKSPNFILHGHVSKDEFFDLLDHKTTFVLSSRSPEYPENLCNFPSKIIEGLLHNRAIVSTLEYPQLDGINYLKIGSSVDEMCDGIRRVCAMADDDLAPYVNQGETVRDRFSPEVWRKTMEQIERPYDAVYLTNTPSFYKLNLCEAIARKDAKMLLVLYGYGSEAVNTALSAAENWQFDWTFLHSGDSHSRSHWKVWRALRRLMRSVGTRNVVYSGWLAPEYNVYAFLSPRRKNLMVCESTLFEVPTKGIKGWVKRRIIARMRGTLPSGTPHRQLLEMLGHSGPHHITGSVGIFDKNHTADNLTAENRSARGLERLSNGGLKYLYVGRLIDVKNLHLLIEAFRTNGRSLTIVGAGNQEAELRAIAPENVSFAGFVDNAELYKVYNDHDVFILPSFSETWGLVVEEALFRGLPVIHSDHIGAAPDMVEAYDAGVGFRHDSADDLNRAVADIEADYPRYVFGASAIDWQSREEAQVQAYLDAFGTYKK